MFLVTTICTLYTKIFEYYRNTSWSIWEFFFIRYTCKMIRRKKDIYKTLYWEHCALFILGEKENIPFNTENKILKRTLHFFGRLINLKCKMQTTSYTLLSYWECINFNLESQLIINKAITVSPPPSWPIFECNITAQVLGAVSIGAAIHLVNFKFVFLFPVRSELRKKV